MPSQGGAGHLHPLGPQERASAWPVLRWRIKYVRALQRGVQQIIKTLQPKAIYIHYAAHRLDLATLAATNAGLRTYLNETSALIEFIRASPKRPAIFDKEQQAGAAGLQSFSGTRWTVNERSIKSLLDNWAVNATLAAIVSDPASAGDPAAKARGFARAMEEFSFFFMLKLGQLFFSW